MRDLKFGFMGVGNMAQAMIARMLESKVVEPHQIYCSNRSEPRLEKVKATFNINTLRTNEDLVDTCHFVFLCMKPQDLISAIEPIGTAFRPDQTVVSLAAGIQVDRLKKYMLQNPVVCRLMPNTPTKIGRGIMGLYISSPRPDIARQLTHVLAPLGQIISADDEEQLQAILVAASAGTGFVYELMIYWQEWLEEHKFTPEMARLITTETFLGTAMMAESAKEISLEDLQNRVVSKKGVTDAGLASIRENEVERLLRISFEKTAMRDQELSEAP